MSPRRAPAPVGLSHPHRALIAERQAAFVRRRAAAAIAQAKHPAVPPGASFEALVQSELAALPKGQVQL